MHNMKRVYLILIVAFLLIGVGGVAAWRLVAQQVAVQECTRIYVSEGTTFEALTDTLDAHQCLASHGGWNTLARLRGLPQHIKAGSYRVEPNMRVLALVQKLYSGNQDPIRITIGKHRTTESLCQYLGGRLQLEADTLLALLQDSTVCAQYGLTPATILCLFTQNTYEVYWTLTPQALLHRMQQETDAFWRQRQAQVQLLANDPTLKAQLSTRNAVVTLASIVEEETNANGEKADIASVYLNRLRIGMPLQADPTVKYALGDFGIRRILSRMLAVKSPYNTYRHAGLPPGPICIPSVASIDAVLQNKQTSYLYFCAKEDFSGRHNFAATAAEHAVNAQRFHQALDKKRIMK